MAFRESQLPPELDEQGKTPTFRCRCGQTVRLVARRARDTTYPSPLDMQVDAKATGDWDAAEAVLRMLAYTSSVTTVRRGMGNRSSSSACPPG